MAAVVCPHCGTDLGGFAGQGNVTKLLRALHVAGSCQVAENYRKSLQRRGERGGKSNSPKQVEHRRTTAVKAMMRKRFPHDPRWK